MISDAPRLQQLFANPHLDWLIQRLKRRLELGDKLTGSVTLDDATSAQREAADGLLGRKPSRGKTLQIQLPVLEQILCEARLCDTLEEAVSVLAGPVRDQRAARNEIEQRWENLFCEISDRPGSRPEVLAWVEELRASGVLRRLSRNDPRTAAALLHHACSIVDQLPAEGLPLATLAARTTGDSHALDPGTPLSTLVLRVAGLLGGTTRWADAQSRRDTWAGVGILCDELSAPVLTLNLTLTGETALARLLALQAAEGQPTVLTTRQLLQARPGEAYTGSVVYVCENPVVVATAANQLGRRSAPLVCIDGQPKTAARLLLNRLQNSSTKILYHGDFDWPGIRIAHLIHQRHGAEPWRMNAADYLAAPKGKKLEGKPVHAPWDPLLTQTMTEQGHAVFEEQVIDQLLSDLEP